jgi:uncharacterized membrane protein YcjF (UPF0283 family)
MNKKSVSSLILIVFTVFTFSCYSLKREEIETVVSGKKEVKILAVKKTSGELIEFTKAEPGKIAENKIIGVNAQQKPFSIPFSEVEWIKVKKISTGKTIFAVVGILSGIAVVILISKWIKVIQDF